MSTSTYPVTSGPTDSTLADLLARLGDISPARIRLNPPPGMATEADVIAAEGAVNKRLCELIDGTLVEKPMGFVESLLAMFLGRRLGDFVDAHELGVLTGEAGTLRVLPGQVRIPDLAYIAWERLPGGKTPTAPIPAIVPNLVVEVLSVSNTRSEMERKRRDYFAAGVEEIWEIAPAARKVHQYQANGEVAVFDEQDTLTSRLLPGFVVPLRELFAVMDKQR